MDRDDSRDPDAPPSAEEAAEAEALRRALERGGAEAGASGEPSGAQAAADFARAVSLAHGPRPIADGEHRTLVARGIARGEARRTNARRRRNNLTVSVAGALALAAVVALSIRPFSESASLRPRAASAAAVGQSASIEPLVPVRSTQALFHAPFARAGGESARIDRIATARAGDLRDNRFAAWGVR